MATPLQGTKTGEGAIARVRYTHDAMIDLILAQPDLKQHQIAGYFGYTEAWVSRVFGSDAFQARLAERKTELVDPTIVASLNEKITALAHQSLDILADKLQATKSADMALKSLELSTKALGMGARVGNQTNVQNNYVALMPEKATDEQAWATQAKQNAVPRITQPQVVDVTPKEAV